MNNDKKSLFKRSWKAATGVFTSAVVILGFVISKGSDLATILTYFHLEPHPKVVATPRKSVTPQAPIPPSSQAQSTGHANQSITQSSSGNQSPNINGVQGSVDLRYHTHAKAEADQRGSNIATKTKAKPNSGAVQISSGADSPNVGNVGGDVKLTYESQPAAGADKN